MPGIFKKKKASGTGKAGTPKLSKKDARKAALAAKAMTKAEFGIVKAGIAIAVSRAVHSDKAKQLLCGAVERFLQL